MWLWIRHISSFAASASVLLALSLALAFAIGEKGGLHEHRIRHTNFVLTLDHYIAESHQEEQYGMRHVLYVAARRAASSLCDNKQIKRATHTPHFRFLSFFSRGWKVKNHKYSSMYVLYSTNNSIDLPKSFVHIFPIFASPYHGSLSKCPTRWPRNGKITLLLLIIRYEDIDSYASLLLHIIA